MKSSTISTPSFEYARSPYHDWNHTGYEGRSRVGENPFEKSNFASRNYLTKSKFCDCPTYFESSNKIETN